MFHVLMIPSQYCVPHDDHAIPQHGRYRSEDVSFRAESRLVRSGGHFYCILLAKQDSSVAASWLLGVG
jgi:hypothetical protein